MDPTFSRILHGCVDWNVDHDYADAYDEYVASYMGAWIETRAATEFADNVNVASYMGAWIETLLM